MATYYVSSAGSDANNGLGPDASAGTNKPWLTIGKALGVAGISSGDIVYLAPGVYREVVTVNMTSAVAETKVLGDPANAQGFKDGSGALLASGQVQWTGYLTNETTASSTSPNINLNGRDFLTFQYILFVHGNTANNYAVDANTTDSISIQFLDCAWFNGHLANKFAIRATSSFGTALNWIIDRCQFWCASGSGSNASALLLTCTTGVGADYDVNIIIRNSLIHGGVVPGVLVTNSGTSANRGNGVKMSNCTIVGPAIATTATNVSSTVASTVVNCFIYGGNATALNAGTSGQITEDYNLIMSSTARTNVTAGAHSQSGTYSSVHYFGQERIFGMVSRRFGTPWASSPILGFGNDGTQSTYDLDNNPKPAGGATATPAAGCLERGNTWGKETSTVRTGSNALSITGPGYQDFLLPVDAVTTTVTVYMRCDATYAGTKPQIQVLNGSECGVSDATSIAVSAANTWENLQLIFTPTQKGIVTIRLLSSDTNGSGHAYADDFVVA